jgi:hypothetical protein
VFEFHFSSILNPFESTPCSVEFSCSDFQIKFFKVFLFKGTVQRDGPGRIRLIR